MFGGIPNILKRKNMRFSIITVSLNAEKYIKRTIESVLNQSFEDFEIIIKDGESNDETLKMIPDDSRISVISKPDKSVYMAMNQAIGEARGDFVLFLNCGDELFHKDILKNVDEFITRNGELNDVVYYGDSWCNRELTRYPEKISKDFMLTSTICHQSVFFSKDIFLKYGAYDEQFKICSDWKHLYELRDKGARFIYMGFTICDYLGGGLSEGSQGQERMDKEENDIIMSLSKVKQIKYKILKSRFGHFYLKHTDNLQKKSLIDKEELIKKENR